MKPERSEYGKNCEKYTKMPKEQKLKRLRELVERSKSDDWTYTEQNEMLAIFISLIDYVVHTLEANR